jgi:hypothetical protein
MKRWQADQAVQLLHPQPAQRILDIATGTGLAARACVRITHDHWLEYGFLDQLRSAPPATADAVYDSYQSAYRELQTAGTAQHVAMFTRCTFSR